MPLPIRRNSEPEDTFISRCMSELTSKGEGKNRAQRFAICKSRASCSLTDEQIAALGKLTIALSMSVEEITNLSPKMKKKKKDSYRTFKEDDDDEEMEGE